MEHWALQRSVVLTADYAFAADADGSQHQLPLVMRSSCKSVHVSFGRGLAVHSGLVLQRLMYHNVVILENPKAQRDQEMDKGERVLLLRARFFAHMHGLVGSSLRPKLSKCSTVPGSSVLVTWSGS
eukprot:6486837-Amphidinium_carterae.1